MTDFNITDALQPGETWQQSVERRLRELANPAPLVLGDLPLAALQRKLENEWQPDANVLLAPRSVSLASLAVKIVAGTVDGPTGTVLTTLAGEFTAARTALGNYTVTFLPAFAAAPVAVASLAQGVAANTVVQQNGPPTINSMVVLISNPAVAFIDADFSFIAMGLGGA